MKRFSYREQDHAFGQLMLTLRNTMGLNQAGLAQLLGVSRYAVGWSPNGRWLASSDTEYGIRLWDLASSENARFLRHPDNRGNYLYRVAWSPDGQRLASGTHQHGVIIWDVMTGEEASSGRQFPTWFPVVAWSPDGTRLASGARGAEDGELFVWDVKRGQRLRSFVGHVTVVAAVAWDSSGGRLISAGGHGTLRCWDVQSGECLWVREAHNGAVKSLRRSPDGTKLASCGDDGAIMLWDMSSGEHLQTLRRDRPYERLNITGIRGLNEAQKATMRVLGAIENAHA